MPLYPDLLRISLIGSPVGDSAPTRRQALRYFLGCRARQGAERPIVPESGGSAAHLATQLSSDVALINLARTCDIRCDVASFDQPERERSRLERAIAEQGICLDEEQDDQRGTPDALRGQSEES